MERDRQGLRTEERYSQSVRTVKLIACRVFLEREKYKEIELTHDFSTAIEELLAVELEEKEEFMESVHQVLRRILFEKSSIAEGSRKLFASVIGACLCV